MPARGSNCCLPHARRHRLAHLLLCRPRVGLPLLPVGWQAMLQKAALQVQVLVQVQVWVQVWVRVQVRVQVQELQVQEPQVLGPQVQGR